MGRNSQEFRGSVLTPISEVNKFASSDFSDGDWSDPIRMSSIDRESCNNYHSHNEDHLDDLKKDISTKGMKTPVEATRLDNGETLLTEGHHRVIAARELGLTHIPVVFK
jgi:hypothetical protein